MWHQWENIINVSLFPYYVHATCESCTHKCIYTRVCVQVTHKRYMPFRLLPNWPVQPMWLDITGRGSTIQRRIFKDCMCVVIIDPNTSDMIRFQVSVLGTISTYFSPVWTSDNIWLKIFLYSQYDSYYSWKVCIPNMKVNIAEREQYTITE